MLCHTFAEYKEAIKVLTNTSKHIVLITEIIKHTILPKLTGPRSLLDVGAGSGRMAKRLLNEFNEVSAIEVNPKLKFAYRNSKIKLYNCDFMEMEFANRFDLIICSHVLYHLPKRQMLLFIKKLLALLSPRGYCLIAMMAPRGQNHTFHQLINVNYINSKAIMAILNKCALNYELIQVHNSFHTKKANVMRKLLQFFAVEDCHTANVTSLSQEALAKINGLIEQQLLKCHQGKQYELQQEEDYFIIAAPTK